MRESVKRRESGSSWFSLSLLAFAAAACGSSIEDGKGQPGAGGSGQGSGGTTNIAGGPVLEGNTDPGRVPIHRLNNTEYNNTVRDLLGTSAQPASAFLAEDGLNFDNTASALGMTSAQYEAYFKAAGDLMTEAGKTPAELSRFMTCTPTKAADPCARQIIEAFGAKVYRRPL